MELTPLHLRNLERIRERGFELVSFPLFASNIGVSKFGCAALLRPAGQGRLELAAAPAFLVEGNLSVLVERGGEQWFVWKSQALRATQERLEELRRFEQELGEWIERQQPV